MADLASNRAALRTKFELEKRHHSHADFRPKALKSQPKMEPSSLSNYGQRQKAMEMEEIIKHMKHLPSYLESGKHIPDRGLSYGVMDWGRLEKWQDRHHKHNKCSSSSSYSSLFSTIGSSPQSSRDLSCSPARPKVHRVTLQSHFTSSPIQDPIKYSKGKLKIQDGSVNELQNVQDPYQPKKHETLLFSAKNMTQDSQMERDFSRNQNSPSRNKTPERKTSNFKISDLRTSNSPVIKPRSVSPLRRLSFSLGMSSKSATERQDQSPVSNRAHTSPLRRLLDPIFPSKACHEDSRTKAKGKLDFRDRVELDDVSSSSSSSRKQALFQTTIKNDRLLFTFAVENNDILAATLTSLSCSGKEDTKNGLYTFFTVEEIKKKNAKWLSHGTKTNDHGYVPNITAQMKVSNLLNPNTREFVLFSVNPNVQPLEELEAIVVKFPRKKIQEDKDKERFSTTVVLPGGNHGVPSKGQPSSLTDRWRSGGACDCGGWDEGCRLRTLTNQIQPARGAASQFELFVQGEVGNKRPMFSFSPLKEGIFSVEYNSSLSPLQAFSICISIVECRKASRNVEIRHEDVPVMYTPIPRIQR